MKKKIVGVAVLSLLVLGACENKENETTKSSSSEIESFSEESSSTTDWDYPPEESSSYEPTMTSGTIGSKIDFTDDDGSKYAITIDKIEKADPDEYNKPENGQFLKVSLTVENTGTSNLNFDPFSFSVYDGNDTAGKVSSRDWTAAGFDLAPGKNGNGVFYLDTSTTGPYEIHFGNIVWDFES